MMSIKDKLMEALQYSVTVKTEAALRKKAGSGPNNMTYILIITNQVVDSVTRYKVEKELEFDSTTIHTVQTMLCEQ